MRKGIKRYIWVLLLVVLLPLGCHRMLKVKTEQGKNREIYLVEEKVSSDGNPAEPMGVSS